VTPTDSPGDAGELQRRKLHAHRYPHGCANEYAGSDSYGWSEHWSTPGAWQRRDNTPDVVSQRQSLVAGGLSVARHRRNSRYAEVYDRPLHWSAT